MGEKASTSSQVTKGGRMGPTQKTTAKEAKLPLALLLFSIGGKE